MFAGCAGQIDLCNCQHPPPHDYRHSCRVHLFASNEVEAVIKFFPSGQRQVVIEKENRTLTLEEARQHEEACVAAMLEELLLGLPVTLLLQIHPPAASGWNRC